MKTPRVILDLVAVQSPSYKGRGIARYSADFARAMVRRHPEMVSSIVAHPELSPLKGLDDLADWVTTAPDWAEASVLHLSSAFELEVPVTVFWPRQAAAHGLLTAVTVYDLIPDVFPGWYLEDPGLRRRWRSCREVVRVADAVLTLSEATKQDTVALLGVPEKRVSVVGTGVAPVFGRPKSRPAAFKVARRGVKGLEPGFVLYQGAFNPRKNVDRLMDAYARLPRTLIERHQLVIACEAPPLTRNHYLVMAGQLGVEGRALIPGFVPDEVLAALYQSAELAVYPSLYEGYGLPVLESMACGAPTIASDNSSLREILPRDARFEPNDPEAMAEAIARGLTDTAFRHRLSALAGREPPSWDAVADKAAQAFEELCQRRGGVRPGWRRRPHVALVGTPPELGDALRPLVSYDWFCALDESTETSPEIVFERVPLPYSALANLDAWRGGYDAIIAWAAATAPTDGARTAGGAGRAARAMEQVVVRWPERTVVIVGRGTGAAPKRALSRWEALGVQVIAVDAQPMWGKTADMLARSASANLARSRGAL